MFVRFCVLHFLLPVFLSRKGLVKFVTKSVRYTTVYNSALIVFKEVLSVSTGFTYCMYTDHSDQYTRPVCENLDYKQFFSLQNKKRKPIHNINILLYYLFSLGFFENPVHPYCDFIMHLWLQRPLQRLHGHPSRGPSCMCIV